MTKRKGRRGRPSGSSQPPVSRSSQLQQIQSLQQEMMEAQEEIAEMQVTTTAGGGAVTAVVTGDKRLQSLTIVPEVVDPEDIEMLQDLVLAAVNEGMEQVDQTTAERMESLTAGLGVPGLL